MKLDLQKITEVIKPDVEALGYELVDVSFSVQYGNDTLTVVIFKKGNMSHEDCVKVNDVIDARLDALNPSKDKPYNLEVSSMGLDRPLKTDVDFARRDGEELEFSLFKKIGDAKRLTGFVTSLSDDALTVSLTDVKSGKRTGKEISLDRKNVAKACVAIRFE